MPIVSQRIAQADDPIYKSGLVMSFHKESKEPALNINELSDSLKKPKDNTLVKEKEESTEDSSS